MPCMPDHQPRGLRLHIILLEVAVFILGLSAFTLSHQPVAVWLVGAMLITVHTLLFYRLGKIAERLSTAELPAFLRGFKKGLLGRRD